MAGIIAAVTSQDWRAGILSQAGTPEGEAVRDAFVNGAHYFCGLCNPSMPPFVSLPQVAELNAGAAPADWQAAVDELVKQGVQTVYVAPAVSTPDLLSYIAQANLKIIGGQTPPAAVSGQWVATVSSDPLATLRQVWPDLLNGKSGGSLTEEVTLNDVKADVLTPGRQQVVLQARDDLAAGLIVPGNPPAQ